MLASKAAFKVTDYFRQPSSPFFTHHGVGRVARNAEINYPRSKPNFDISKVVVEPGHSANAEEVQPFYLDSFKQQPIINSLMMNQNSVYLSDLAKKYSTSGDRWLAYQIEPRMRKKRLIGAMAAYWKFPWEARKLEHWASRSAKPESIHMKFFAHCFRHSDVFNKYKVPYVYDIEMLSLDPNVVGHGAEDLLLQSAIINAVENRVPLVQIFSTNTFLNGACERAGMTNDWSMTLADYIDDQGLSAFTTVDPNATISIYIRLFSPKQIEVPYNSKLPAWVGNDQIKKEQSIDSKKKLRGVSVMTEDP